MYRARSAIRSERQSRCALAAPCTATATSLGGVIRTAPSTWPVEGLTDSRRAGWASSTCPSLRDVLALRALGERGRNDVADARGEQLVGHDQRAAAVAFDVPVGDQRLG